jgi:hypothetical protein
LKQINMLLNKKNKQFIQENLVKEIKLEIKRNKDKLESKQKSYKDCKNYYHNVSIWYNNLNNLMFHIFKRKIN